MSAPAVHVDRYRSARVTMGDRAWRVNLSYKPPKCGTLRYFGPGWVIEDRPDGTTEVYGYHHLDDED